ncbi:MAG: cytidyltransferase, partial [Clostridiales bacterium]|nr:cytidyltransferase [Clostridiales bacterium]
FNIKIKRGNTQAVFLLMNTLGIAITHYTEYINSFNEDRDTSFSRLEQMLGMLLLGYAHYNDEIRQEAFAVLSNIFDTYILSLKEKQAIFDIIGKKILVLLAKCEVSNPLFMNNATSLNRIYRFISEYIHKYGNLELSHPNKIAFFPGTFDPFSLSNKEAAVQIRNMGYEVYLAIDEFSWFKSTQPHLQRQKIVSMSIADERNIYIFPEDIPINIDNPMDMEKLRNIFNNKDITVVIGSNVLVQASCYQSKATGHSIHHFPHIILKRPYLDDEESKNAYDNTLAKLTGPVEELELSEEFRNIRSSLIRKSIDENRDISNLVDPLVQKYIYEQGMYLREPQFKALLKNHAIAVKHYRAANKQLLEALTEALFDNRKEYYQTLHSLVKNKNAEILVLYNTDDEYKILGFSIFHGINSGSFYTEFKNHYVSEHIRQHSIGRMIVIDGIFTEKNAPDSSEQIILSETLALTLSQDYTYAVYKSVFVHENNNKIYDILELQGFEEILRDGTNAIYDVDMSKPCVLNLDVLSFIKEPFRSNDKVIQAVKDARMKLQNALVSLFPGNLVLSFEREALYHSLIEKVCKANNVPEKPLYPRHLGPNMCVPFGQILKEDIVPNTLTKALHTEKIYYPDASDFFIGPYPQYLSLENQIKVLRSFNRPIILLDDILHKGYRIKALSPILNKEELRVEKIIVGILSSKGKELMDTQGHQIDAAYYIPNLKNWFTEAMLYPFIGGDSIIQASAPVKNLLPSVNLIFPYASPFFIKGASLDSLMTLSKVCIENAMSILRVLENQYQLFHGRSLTLNYLGEVLVSLRYPDKGQDVHHNYNDKASAFLSSDLDHLSRMRHIVSPDKNEL